MIFCKIILFNILLNCEFKSKLPLVANKFNCNLSVIDLGLVGKIKKKQTKILI